MNVTAEEKTLLMVKPDGVRSLLTGEVILRVERKRLHISRIRKFVFSEDLAKKFYEVHSSKPFYADLVKFITSGEVVALEVEGPSAVQTVRRMIGPTNAAEAPPGTIRGDYSNSIQENVVHASDSPENAVRELELVFGKR
ncbi:MAG: nucleoside-diphosphate kinase [Thermoprotei archaeon]